MANIIINKLRCNKETLLKIKEHGFDYLRKSPEEWDRRWCVENWGTKWDRYASCVLVENKYFSVLYFITANGSIEPLLDFIKGPVQYEAIDIDNGETSPRISREIINELLRIN